MIATLSELIARVESNNDSRALRYEPNYTPDTRAFSILKTFNGSWSQSTMRICLASSWGKYQIMGDNLYLQGLEMSLQAFWGSDVEQDAAFQRFIEARGIDFTLSQVIGTDDQYRLKFARRYNGSLGYADRIMNVWRVNS